MFPESAQREARVHEHDDFQMEPIRGLPERPPEGEKILWQGAPDWWALAREAMIVHWIAGYFLFLAAWRTMAVASESGLLAGLYSAYPLVVLGALASGLIVLIAYIQARATVYTITNRRVAMRIGAALTVTLNLPFRWIGSADLDLRRNGTGTIALQLLGTTRLSYLVCWPHIRPWHMSPTRPALRCVPDAEHVARLLAEAAEARLEEIDDSAVMAAPVPAE